MKFIRLALALALINAFVIPLQSIQAAAEDDAQVQLKQQWLATLEEIDTIGWADIIGDVVISFVPYERQIRKVLAIPSRLMLHVKSDHLKYAGSLARYPLKELSTFQIGRLYRAAMHVDKALKLKRYGVAQDLLSYGLCPFDNQTCKDEVRAEILRKRGLDKIS